MNFSSLTPIIFLCNTGASLVEKLSEKDVKQDKMIYEYLDGN